MFKDGVLKTPSENILKGITRKIILNLAPQLFETSECNIPLTELLNADEIFLTGTTKIILPITKVDSKVIGNGIAGPNTLKLLQMFREYERCY